MGIPIKDSVLYTLLFADDQVVIAACREDAKYMTRKLNEKYNKWGLEINYKKTDYLVQGTDGKYRKIVRNIIKVFEDFKYLGSTFTSQ